MSCGDFIVEFEFIVRFIMKVIVKFTVKCIVKPLAGRQGPGSDRGDGHAALLASHVERVALRTDVLLPLFKRF